MSLCPLLGALPRAVLFLLLLFLRHGDSFLNSTDAFKMINLVANRFFSAENRRCKSRRGVRLYLWNEVGVNRQRYVDVGMAEHGAYFRNRGSIHQVD